MKKILIFFTIVSMALGAWAADFKATLANVKPLGRTYYDGDILWACFSATGAAFITDSANLDITIAGDNNAKGQPVTKTSGAARLAIYVDGIRTHDMMVANREEKVKVYSANSGSHEIRIVKLSEAPNSAFGIESITVDDGATIKPAPSKKRKIEFIGDSITCGYGVDDEDRNHNFSTTTEDATKTYAYKTAQALDADYSFVCCSGWGVVSGYTGNGQKNNESVMKKAYEKIGYGYYSCRNNPNPQMIPWDFSNFQPDVIVINLGTNDSTYTKGSGDKVKEFQAEYGAFLKMVRKNNPLSKIVCTMGMMGADLYNAMNNAVKSYSAETGDNNITVTRLPGATVLCADWHPAESSHEKAAQALLKELKFEF